MNKKKMFGGFDFNGVFPKDDNVSLEKYIKDGIFMPDSIGCNDESILIYAVKAGATRCFDLLLRLGANINYLDNERRSALFYAIYGKNSKFAVALIEAGADLNIEFEYRFTPLIMCLTQKSMRSQIGRGLDFELDCDLIIKALLLRGSKLENVPGYARIAPWMKELETKVEAHRQLALSVYASQRKTEQKACFPPKEIVAVISKMIWEKKDF
jgi:hypothetical protein